MLRSRKFMIEIEELKDGAVSVSILRHSETKLE